MRRSPNGLSKRELINMQLDGLQVRYASNSNQILRRNKMTRCANSRHRIVHSGSPAFLKPSANLAKSSGSRRGTKYFRFDRRKEESI